MIGYEFIVMSLMAGACLVLMPYVVKKIEAFIGFTGPNKNKRIEP